MARQRVGANIVRGPQIYAEGRLWNNVPLSTRKVDSVACFKQCGVSVLGTSNFYIIFKLSNRVLYDPFSII